MTTFRAIGLSLAALLSAALAGCATAPQLPPSAEFRPILQLPPEPEAMVTGSIYNGGRNDNWFGRKRDYKVGDIITVVLNESTNASRTVTNKTARASSNDVAASLVPKLPFPQATNGLVLSGATIKSEASGAGTQIASLSGAVTATVIQVLPNGNLVVRGEKQVDLSEGSETIRVAGTVRTDDISPDGTVQSKRLANAQISYVGTGDLANANRTPWGTNLLYQLWPF